MGLGRVDPRRIEQLQDATRRAERRLTKSVGKPFGEPTVTKTSDYTAAWGEIVQVDPTLGAVTIDLPKPQPEDRGKLVVVKNVSSSTNTITIRNLHGLIDSAAAVTIVTAYGERGIYCDG